MRRVAIFEVVWGHFFVFDRKFDMGQIHNVPIWSSLITFYGIYFVSKLCPLNSMFFTFEKRYVEILTRHFLASCYVTSHIVNSSSCQIVDDDINT